MKHAYLILCHADLHLLKILIGLLDDERNDLFIHIDRKADFTGSGLSTTCAGLYILEQRLDARWGDYSLVDVEMMLFEKAYNTDNYVYFHVLSGSDLPIKSQNYIHKECDMNPNIEYIGFSGSSSDKEAQWRASHYFLFSKKFRTGNIVIRLLRRLFLLIQYPFDKIHNNKKLIFKKGPQWCSVTSNFVGYLLQNKSTIKKLFSHTYCPDELFIQTLCWNSSFRLKVKSLEHEFEGCRRYIKWVDGELQDMTQASLLLALQSNHWFARKFSSNNPIIRQLIENAK